MMSRRNFRKVLRMTNAPKIPSYYLLIGGGVGGAVLAILLVLAGWWMFTGGEKMVSRDAETAPPSPEVAIASTGPDDPKEASEKLSQIALAFHQYHDLHKIFAPIRAQDLDAIEPDRIPQPTRLSWRVHLLPYLEQKPLYDRFHLDEPWDSPHNKTLLDQMPEVFRLGAGSNPTTRFQVITGPNMLFGREKAPRFADLRDGLRHTILVLVTGPDRSIPWTQPDTLTLDPTQPLAALGTMPDNRIKCVMADGKPLLLPDNVSPSAFLALATPNGNEVVDADGLRRRSEESWQQVSKSEEDPEMPATTASPASQDPPAPAAPAAPPRQTLVKQDRQAKLKQLVMAMHTYHDTHRQFPHSDQQKWFDKEGQPLLSWRVHLLPFLGQQPLYSQFKLDEPWDSSHNKTLIEQMPDVFRDPDSEADSTQTRFVVFTGQETPFPDSRGVRFPDFRDGISTTLLIVVAGADKAVTWTKPEDITFDADSPLHGLGNLEDSLIYYARADGAVGVLPSDIPPQLFKAMVTPAGGETLPKEFVRSL